MFLELKEGDKVVYVGDMPYILANGQEVEKEGDELLIRSDVQVQKQFFHKVEEKKVEKVQEPTKVEEPTKPANKKTNKK